MSKCVGGDWREAEPRTFRWFPCEDEGTEDMSRRGFLPESKMCEVHAHMRWCAHEQHQICVHGVNVKHPVGRTP